MLEPDAAEGKTDRERLKSLEKSVQLLVEGNDQVNFFKAFLRHLYKTGKIQVPAATDGAEIWNFGGVQQLKTFLVGFPKVLGFTSVKAIGIVRDAEESSDQAFQSVQDALRGAKLPVPDRLADVVPPERSRGVALPVPATSGVGASFRCTVSVLVLPGNGGPGMLETLLCQTFADTEEDRCIQDFFSCIVAAGVTIKRPPKARARAYVVTKPEPHVSVGVAAQKGYWDFDHKALDGVRQFLVALHRS